jgi:tetratricopeptide (TPR) repeat protein
MTEKTTPREKKRTTEDRFEYIMSILIAAVTILAAIVAYLQADASSCAATAARQADRFTMESLGGRNSGEVQVGYALYSAQSWYELGMLAHSARQSYDYNAARRYQEVSGEVAALSPFLSEYGADLLRYEAEVYLVRAVELSERATSAAIEEDSWDARAGIYIVHLTLLAVALALYGLSMAVSGGARWTFVLTGSLVVVVILGWTAIAYQKPIVTIPEAAIAQFARGAGLAHYGDHQQSIAAFDQALDLAPDYSNALFERGNAHYALGEYNSAAADYVAARIAGLDNANLAWNLGWTYYMQGDFELAVEVDRHALAMDPGLLPVRLNLGLALLASGQVDAAQDAYAEALELAAKEVARAREAGQELPYSFWYYLDVGARDLKGLLDQARGQPYPWAEAPPAEEIAAGEQILAATEELFYRLKSWSVSLEQRGQPPVEQRAVRISALHFTPPEGMGGGGFSLPQPRTPFEAGLPFDLDRRQYVPYGGSGYVEPTMERSWALGDFYAGDVEAFPYDEDIIGIEFDYEGMQPGQEVIWRVYRNGEEDLSLRWSEPWPLNQSGGARRQMSFVFGGEGTYEVEMYVDSWLVQRGSFRVQPPDAGPSQATLFEDDFADPATGRWRVSADPSYETGYQGEAYRIEILQEDLYVGAWQQENWADVQIEVDTSKVQGPDGSLVGIMCQLQETASWNGYTFVISADGRAGIIKWRDGEMGWLQELRPVAAIRRGETTNHIMARCSGGVLEMEVNSTPVAYSFDDEFKSGGIGLVAGSVGSGMAAHFDNLVVLEVVE